MKCSEETKRKISEAQKGKPRPYLKNVIRTKEWYEKIVASRRRNGTYFVSEEKRERMRQGAVGRIMPKMSEESKEKKRQSNLRTWANPLLREKLSKIVKEKIKMMSPERRNSWREKNLIASRSEKNRERSRRQMLELMKDEVFVKRLRKIQSEAMKKRVGEKNFFFGKKHTIESRIKTSISKKNSKKTLRGKDNPAWIDGKGSERRGQRTTFHDTLEYRLFREGVFKRDDYTCVLCKKRGIKICADHIKSYRNYPELRTDVNNGRTLCLECHRKTPNYGRKEEYAKPLSSSEIIPR